ncbi:electron transport complex subunit RsxC [Alteromonas pelagimontana]|uniref:Ion-translocating oxidoreductase complex subunit C n=1 Tax=Alteromonas pelagimontana TaxID=1858656 RepID=A0A6M4MHW6_9ALTE|nr:electron transport complex subunit RsxC [Alteromonas pelagimontana]QJR82719.1 electron transport complex subunit RsxC [Alteromonas pelagimontana]
MHPSFENIVEKIAAGKLETFPGGVHPEDRKSLSNQQPIARISLPALLTLPVRQHIGTEGKLVVNVGDKVLKGQPLTHSGHPFAIPIHAPTSGEIVAIEPHVTAHPSGLSELCVSLRPDGEDKWIQRQTFRNFTDYSPAKLVEAICNAGISGMGGAGFPTHIKTTSSKKIEFLVINGAECEPYITADDRLMREHAWQIRQGIDVLHHLVSPKKVVVAIEDNKPEAIDAMRIACQDKDNILVVGVETKYPAGGEKQLLQILTGREVPRDGLPADVGVLMFNVGTCFAIADAIFQGKPLIERVVTVTGEAVDKPGNYWTALGTPVNHLLGQTGYNARKQKQPQVIMGGPMMGFTLNDAAVPVVKITNCLLVPADNELKQSDNETACIRCGACSDVCPATLLPQQLFWHAKAKEYDKTEEYNLFDCIECGACAYVCPSEIPLVHYYRQAKADIRIQRDEKVKSEKAKERFEARKARLEREKIEREAKHQQAKEARERAAKAPATEPKDKVAAALARAKAKKAVAQQSDTAESDPRMNVADESKSQAVDAIARAKAKQAAPAPDSATLTDDTPENADAARRARVAAAVARAKAKKANQANDTASATPEQQPGAPTLQAADNNETQPVDDDVAKKSAPTDAAESSNRQSDDEKKRRIAAAVARAKAKKASQANDAASAAPEQQPGAPTLQAADNNETQTVGDDVAKKSAPVDAAESSDRQSDDEKKRRIAAAVARAKAKKQARKNEENNN